MDSIPPAATTIEALLRERAWVARLARGLARDPHAADDLEQESWLGTLLRPPRHAGNLRSWLAQRVRHTFQTGARGDARRVRREELAARAEAESETQAAVERAELAREMVEIVLKLEEPYRSALVLVYLEGLTPGEVARRQGLPASTVRTHVQRGLERVRAELARRRGDWRSALSALAITRNAASTATVFLAAGTVIKAVAAAAALVLALLAIRAWQAGPAEPSPLFPATPSVSLASDEPRAAEPRPDADRAAVTMAPVVASQHRQGLRIRAVHERDGSPLADAALRVRWFDNAWRARAWYLRTDAQGRAELAMAPAGRAVVESDHGGWVEGVVDPVDGLDLELRVDDRVQVRGRVVDPRGTGVAGASVRVGWNSNPEEDLEIALSDASGRFAFTSTGGGRHVGAWHAAYAASPRVELDWQSVATSVEIELRLGGPGAALAVRVVRPDGTPAAGARVRPRDTRTPNVSLPDGSKGLPPGGWSATCDAAGRVLVQGLPPGPMAVLAGTDSGPTKSGDVTLQAGTTAELELQLPRGSSLRGVLRNADGTPAPDALVRIGDAHVQHKLHLDEWECWKRTAPDGTYAFEGLRPGPRRVLADGDARGRRVTDLALEDGAEAVWDAVLDMGRIVRGRVVDHAGAPLGGWRVRAETVQRGGRIQGVSVEELFGWPSNWGSAKTDARGEFTLANQLPCELSLTVMGPDFDDRTPRLVRAGVRAGGEPLELVVDTQALTAWIVGRVLDPEGLPASARVLVVSEEETFSRPMLPYATDPVTGTFRVGPLLTGVYRVSVQSEGWPALRGDPVGLSAGEKDVGDLRLQRPASLQILVRAPDVPEPELRVSASGPGDHHVLTVVEGRVSIGGLAPGRWTLRLYREGAPSALRIEPTTLDLEAGREVNVELTTEPR